MTYDQLSRQFMFLALYLSLESKSETFTGSVCVLALLVGCGIVVKLDENDIRKTEVRSSVIG